MKKLLLLLATVGMIFTACEGGEGIEEDNGGAPFVPEITISPDELSFPVEGGEQEVAITANFEYEVSEKADWLSVEQTETGLLVKVDKSECVENRYADIVLTNTEYDVEKFISVSQVAFEPSITIKPSVITFYANGGEQEAVITSNVEYEVSEKADWLSVEQTEMGLIVTAKESKNTSERTAEITISNEKYGISKVVNVTQGAFVPDGIIVEPKSLTFDYKGGTKEVAVTANFECEYSTNVDWLTIEKSEKGVNISATPNTKFEECTAEITISNNKYNISKTISVVQNGVSAEAQNVIIYTSSDGNIVTPYESNVFGANIISNTYRDGQGIIIFDGPVTSIGSSAFYDCDSLTSVTIPDSVTSIGYRAFDGCSSLKAFYGKFASSDNYCLIVDGVLNSFAIGCGLTQYAIPDSVTSIGNNAFYRCERLRSVTIGNSVTSIGSYAFYYCTSLKSITIPDSVTSIGYYAFAYCYSLTSVTIPDSVTSIRNYAFDGCSSLTSVDITDLSAWCKIDFGGTTANPLYYAKKLYLNGAKIITLTIPSDITEIKDYAFWNCTSLTSITIPDSITSIGEGAFYGCTSLTSITIPDSVTSIGMVAFYRCKRLKSVTIGNSVTSIGYDAFYSCTSLKEVYCKPTTPPAGSGSMFSSNALGRKIYVPRNSVEAYKSAEYWKYYADYIEGYDF